MKVSLITPTHQRCEAYLESLYCSFQAQTYADLELLILDDSPEPSQVFEGVADDRVTYLHSSEKLTVGQKRNQLIQKSTGDVIMHFDDDDYYSPIYVVRMLEILGQNDFVTLSGWYAYAQVNQALYYWDTANVADQHFRVSPGKEPEVVPTDSVPSAEKQQWAANNLWGYGFSYVYRRELWEAVPFSDTVVGWNDFHFAMNVVNAGRYKASYAADQDGLVLHTIHTQNISMIYPQFILPKFLLGRLFGSEIQDYLDVVNQA